MKGNLRKRAAVLAVAAAAAGALIGLPLLGAALTGQALSAYLEFPPVTRYVQHAPFDMRAFLIIGVLDVILVAGIAIQLRRAWRHGIPPAAAGRPHARLPLWGWLGLGIMLAGWFIAWTRLPLFSAIQAHTFCIPWIGYILLVNAWCVRNSGRSPMTHATAGFLLLWPASALFWWFFEYLNRFVQNWYYIGVSDYTPLAYVGHASLAFSTVLPAVLSTRELLLTYPLFSTGLATLDPVPLPRGRAPAAAALLASAAGLTLIGTFPDLLYPLVWAAPLLVITSIQALGRRPTVFAGMRSGDWRAPITAALAALICGFFWELWNYKSLARWEYAIPYVDCCRIFAMPLLGYGGYLPFGLECLVAGQWVLKPR